MYLIFNMITFLVLLTVIEKPLIASQADELSADAAAIKKHKILQEIEEENHRFVTIKSITEAEKEFTDIDKTTLCLFDVDSTLTYPGNLLLSREVRTKFQGLYSEILRDLNPIQRRVFEHLQVMHEPRKLVEEVFPDVIKAMQQKESKVFAFTSATMASLNHESGSFSDWRYKELKSFGIDFTKAYSDKVFFKEEGLDHTGIDRGIIYCGFDEDKTHTLPSVFKILKDVPESVIFIDDKAKNVTQVSDFLKKHYPSVSFLGITYAAMDNSFDQDSDKIKESDFIKIIKGLIEKTKQLYPDLKQSCPNSNFTPLSPDLKSQSHERVRHGTKRA